MIVDGFLVNRGGGSKTALAQSIVVFHAVDPRLPVVHIEYIGGMK